MPENTIYILDSYGLIYRSYYAFINRPLINDKGQNVSAIYGFFRNLLSLFRTDKPHCIVAAFDSRTPTFRHEMYSDYKATRQKTPEDLHAQIPMIEEILNTLGVPVLRCDGYEADDIIATIAARCTAEKRGCRILSGDKDLMQLVNDTTLIMKPDKTYGGWETVDAEGVKEEWGVGPELMLDILSLIGDKADNVPGVPGVGEKTAVKFLLQYGTLDGIYEHAEEIGGAIGNKVRAGKESAYFSKSLIKLCEAVPVPTDLCKFSVESPNYADTAKLLFNYGVMQVARDYAKVAGISLSGGNADANSAHTDTRSNVSANTAHTDTRTNANGNSSLVGTSTNANANSSLADTTTNVSANSTLADTRTNADANSSAGGSSVPQAPDTGELEAGAPLKKNPGIYTAITDIETLSDFIDKALEKGICAFDCETDGLNTLTCRLAGFSLSIETGKAFYIPLITPDALFSGPILTKDEAFVQLRRIFCPSEKMTLIMHNGKFDYEVLFAQGLFASHGECTAKIVDTMVACWLLESDRTSFSLENLAERKLGLAVIPFKEVVPKGGCFTDVPLEKAVQYAAEDADLTWQLWQLFAPKLEATGFSKLFYDLEMPVLKILASMEIAGIHIEKDDLETYSVELSKELEESQADIFKLVGHEFNIASPKQLQEVLFTERQLPAGKKTKTGFSTDTSVLEELAALDPVPAKILDYRAMAKLLSTYVDALPLLADENGRIHTTFIQTGTATGRLSSRDPNLQNIPVREEAGRRIRQAFSAQNGRTLISADYSQIELVILAHLSNDKNLCDAFKQGIDVHKATASLIFGVDSDQVTADMRRTAKTINFGVMYGMSAFRLANELRISRTQAQNFINQYFATYSGIRSFIDDTIQKCEQTGYVETILGRRRYIPTINTKNKTEKSGAERIAVNTPIQGSAADIVKQAMIAVYADLTQKFPSAQLLLQVHDELIVECDDTDADEIAQLIQKDMESIVKLNVPLRVSVEKGKRWGEFH